MEFEKKNILIVISNLGRGGAQQVFRDQLRFFTEKHNTVGCVFNWDETFKDDRQPNMISLDVPGGRHVVSKLYFFLKRILALRRLKKKYNIDISISHLEGADYVNLFSKRKEKVICWIHGTKAFDKEIEGPIGIIRKKFLIPLTYRLADKIVTVSEGIRKELIHIFHIPEKKIETIYNSFILEEIESKAKHEISPDFQGVFDSPVLITHCRLSRPKNLFRLIDIYRVIKDRSNTKLMILGDGDLREELLKYCSDSNLNVYSVWNLNSKNATKDSDIFFIGYERNPYPFLRRASLYIMTSLWEGFPLSLCEAMACGTPVIAPDCYTGPREIIAPELSTTQPVQEPVTTPFGTLMPLANDSNIKIWAGMVESILKDADRRKQFIQNGKDRISRFDRKTVSLQWLSVLK